VASASGLDVVVADAVDVFTDIVIATASGGGFLSEDLVQLVKRFTS